MRHLLAEADADVWAISAPRDLILPFSSYISVFTLYLPLFGPFLCFFACQQADKPNKLDKPTS
jgi:hypothetical protein